jgi:hypothetical protein
VKPVWDAVLFSLSASFKRWLRFVNDTESDLRCCNPCWNIVHGFYSNVICLLCQEPLVSEDTGGVTESEDASPSGDALSALTSLY